jgi:hypothetical protein
MFIPGNVGMSLSIHRSYIWTFQMAISMKSGHFTVKDVAMAQDYAFFIPGHNNQYIYVVALQDRENQEVAATITSRGVQDIAVNGNYLYVLDNELGLRIFDITNPLDAKEVGGVSSLAGLELAVTGPLAYIAAGSQGIGYGGCTESGNSCTVGNHHTVGIAYGATAAGHYAYVSSDRLDVIDISNPPPERLGVSAQ